jgi:plastocyanin
MLYGRIAMSKSDAQNDGPDSTGRRTTFKCMVWAGTLVVVAALMATTLAVPRRAQAEAAAVKAEAKPQAWTVKIDNFTFGPQRLTVKTGTTVTWRNEDDIPHTVASAARAFKSKALDTDDAYSFTFTTPGIYEYFCSLHPHMRGTIVVEGTVGTDVTQ